MDQMIDEPDEVPPVTLESLGLRCDCMSVVPLAEYPDLREYDVTGRCRQVLVLPDSVSGIPAPHIGLPVVSSRIADAQVHLF